MADYISREPMIEEMRKLIDSVAVNFPNATETELIILKGKYEAFIEYIQKQPAADVQPAPQWISVKERLPDEDGWYLVCKHNRVRAAEWCKDCWYNESDLPIDDCAITYWQLLPEPPKE